MPNSNKNISNFQHQMSLRADNSNAGAPLSAGKELYIISGSYGTAGTGAAHPGGLQAAMGDGSVRGGTPAAPGQFPYQVSLHSSRSSGDIDGDGRDDLLSGAGSSGGHVKVFGADPAQLDLPDLLVTASQHSAQGPGVVWQLWREDGLPAASLDHDATVLAGAPVGGSAPAGQGLGDHALITDFSTSLPSTTADLVFG